MAVVVEPDYQRVIIHADLDSFYAQVEAIRLGLQDRPPPQSTNSNNSTNSDDCNQSSINTTNKAEFRKKPLAVRQWNRVIAVNYEARRLLGITRQDTHTSIYDKITTREEASTKEDKYDELKKKEDVEIYLPHVPTFDLKDFGGEVALLAALKQAYNKSKSAKHDHTDFDCGILWKYGTDRLEDCLMTRKKRFQAALPDQNTHKVSLDPYRHASHTIWSCIRQFLSSLASSQNDAKDGEGIVFALEKASVDEAFLDVTAIVQERIAAANSDLQSMLEFYGKPAASSFRPDEGNHFPILKKSDAMIAIGTEIAHQIRQHVYNALGYTISCGIAHNKTLAKLASPMAKPNGQAYCTAAMVPEVMRTTKLEDIRMLGGKLGARASSSSKRFTEEDVSSSSSDDDGSEIKKESSTVMAGDVAELPLETLQAKVGSAGDAAWIRDLLHGFDPAPIIDDLEVLKTALSTKTAGSLSAEAMPSYSLSIGTCKNFFPGRKRPENSVPKKPHNPAALLPSTIVRHAKLANNADAGAANTPRFPLESWCRLMAAEIWMRLREECHRQHQIFAKNFKGKDATRLVLLWPSSLTLHWWGASSKGSRTTAFPLAPNILYDELQNFKILPESHGWIDKQVDKDFKAIASITKAMLALALDNHILHLAETTLNRWNFGFTAMRFVRSQLSRSLEHWFPTNTNAIDRKEGSDPNDEILFGQPLLPPPTHPASSSSPKKSGKKKISAKPSSQIDKKQSKLSFPIKLSSINKEETSLHCSNCSFIAADETDMALHEDYHMALLCSLSPDNVISKPE